MPKRARQVCNVPGCWRLVVKNGRCELHHVEQRREAEARRTPRPRLDTAEWQRASKAWLTEHPACVVCGGPATVVDHVVPHRGRPELFWSTANWQSMCKRDHDRKTASRDGAFNNPRKAEGDR